MNLKKQLKKSVKAVEAGTLQEKATKLVGFPKDVKLNRDGTFAFPDSPGVRADLLYVLREKRLALQRQCEMFDKAESALEQFFIDTLPVSDATGLLGKRAKVQVNSKTVPTVEDWPKFYAHVAKTKSFELLQRRLNESAVKERWEDKKAIPGVGTFIAKKVSCTKI